MPQSSLHPRVGVGVIVLRRGRVLLGLRLGSHGAGTWALPGGHLEFGESIEDCAKREVFEETGLIVGTLEPAGYTNDVMADEGKHYVTVFIQTEVPDGEPEAMEPEKCAEWAWHPWSELPQALFQPLRSLVLSGYVPRGAT